MTAKKQWHLEWHMHHQVLVEPTLDPAERRKYVRESKNTYEIKPRLKLMKPVKGRLPKEVSAALGKLRRAQSELNKRKLTKYTVTRYRLESRIALAERTLVIAIGKNVTALSTLHAKECKNCPWDGTTIFP